MAKLLNTDLFFFVKKRVIATGSNDSLKFRNNQLMENRLDIKYIT